MATTSTQVPKFLILGHSFVRRLKSDLRARFDERARLNFGLEGTAEVLMHGVGGRTVTKLLAHDLGVVANLSPDIIILEIGTKDLSISQPEVVGSGIDDLIVRHLLDNYSVRVVVLCHVTARAITRHSSPNFNRKAALLNQYTRVVLEGTSRAICWTHRGFANPSVSPFLPDGVHFNHTGQYNIYRSYRGAILYALAACRCL